MTGSVRENVQPDPRPPTLAPVAQTITIQMGGSVAALSNRELRVLEAHHAPICHLSPGDGAATPTAKALRL